jgi:glycosyltransferase involved in cell wall biosynthesis
MSSKNGVGLVFAYRHNPNRNVDVCISSIRAWKHLQPEKIYFVDGTVGDTISLPDDLKDVQHIKVPYDGDFNLSFLRNVGMRKCIEDGIRYIQLMDADVFPSRIDYFEECSRLAEQGFDFIMPFRLESPREFPDDAAFGTDEYRSFISINPTYTSNSVHSYSTTFQKIDVCKKLRGFDEKYSVWGGEDDDYYFRVIAAGYKIARLPMDQHFIVHSFHIRDTHKKAHASGAYANNVKRLNLTRVGKLPLVRNNEQWGHTKLPGVCAVGE